VEDAAVGHRGRSFGSRARIHVAVRFRDVGDVEVSVVAFALAGALANTPPANAAAVSVASNNRSRFMAILLVSSTTGPMLSTLPVRKSDGQRIKSSWQRLFIRANVQPAYVLRSLNPYLNICFENNGSPLGQS